MLISKSTRRVGKVVALMMMPLMMVELGLRFNQPIYLFDHFGEWAMGPFSKLAFTIGLIMIPVWFIAVFAPLALAGFRPIFVPKFDLSKLDPIAGLSRMFSSNALVEAVKNLLKIILLMLILLCYEIKFCLLFLNESFKTFFLLESFIIVIKFLKFILLSFEMRKLLKFILLNINLTF
jgi:flagellar biosynthesis protein FlhB